jgi:hypothetical protein
MIKKKINADGNLLQTGWEKNSVRGGGGQAL